MKERRSITLRSPKRAILLFLFSLVCLAGAAGGAWLFWTDLNQFLGRSAEQSVGRLSYKRNTVQRRFRDRLAWSMLPNDSTVYNGDLIRTADLSDATVTMVSGDKIGLSENSLVVIHYDAATGEAKMELLGGKVNLYSDSGMAAIVAGGQELRPSAGSNVEAAGGADHAEFLALSGGAAVAGPGETAALAAGETLVSGSGGVSREPEPVSVLQPLPDQEFDAAVGDVTFLWNYNTPPGEEHIRIEVSPNRRFTDITYTGEYDPAVTTAGFSITPGVWWWRLSRAGQEGAPVTVVREGRISVNSPPVPPPSAGVIALASPVALETLSSQSPLTVPPRAEEEPPPAPQPAPGPALLPRAGGLAPAAGTIIDGDFLSNSRSIVFSWNAVSGADAYICTITQGADILRQVRDPRLELNPLGILANGPCVWRVEAIRLAGDGSIAQRGLVAESRFTVAVPRPGIPQVDNPGIIYE